jgi:methyl-accepting chemotaxis protein
MDVLRRTAGVPKGPRVALEDAALWDARDRAAKASAETARLAERVTASVTRQRSVLDGTVERAALFTSKAEAATDTANRVVEALDRLGVVALNAGLEGARSPDPLGRALLLVSDEIRASVSRGTEAARDLVAATKELTQQANELGQRLDASRRDASEIGGDTALLKTAAQDAGLALTDLEARLRKATGLDPELARSLALAGDHAKGLVMALTAIESREPEEIDRSAVAEALGPVLGPLLKLLAQTADERSRGTEET